ncbi:MAG: polymerase, sigma-24 subunit, subfamily [Actinomycetia bacterium]|nr:polymerase, sigma-24 subunit, subfamily [Actinomycetes bacterium]
MRHADPVAWNRSASPSALLDVQDVTHAATFEAVYAREYVRSVRTAALVIGSQQVAEEVVQEAFVQLLRRWEAIERPEGWLRTAVLNGCRSWQRRHILERQRRPRPDLVTDDPDGLAVREALRVLSPRQRAAVVLRYFDDLSEADIAEALGCRPGTVKSLLARSMPKLEEALGD